ncbi:hypothetical protein M9H77_07808 [Catharanthus roseus]|uniref:Uncharacterized protein n=1 Tax=Catharanthus roseus TaxID=4058 RepID=A0ACC0BWF0_CATRO|nr:hypothetical protein M9H77_07808 [Catharanthus roseus]
MYFVCIPVIIVLGFVFYLGTYNLVPRGTQIPSSVAVDLVAGLGASQHGFSGDTGTTLISVTNGCFLEESADDHSEVHGIYWRYFGLHSITARYPTDIPSTTITSPFPGALRHEIIDKVQAIGAVRKWSISVGREYRVVKSKNDTWTAKYYHHSDDNYCSWYIHMKNKVMHSQWEITRFVKEYTCLVQIEQNKHRNLSSKFISMSISHLVANNPEIPVLNIIQEVQCVEKMGQERILMCRRYINDKRTEELTKRIFIRS